MKRLVFIFIGTIFLSFSNKIKYNNLPNHLFKIERSKDANQIFYDVNKITEDKLNKENPINIYWVRHTEGGKIKPLTWIQQHYAYGLDFIYASENIAKFHFVSYDKIGFTLKKDSNGNFNVYTIKNKSEVIVNRIFIQIDGGTFWFPKISKVELYLNDPFTNIEEVVVINP
jgi:hypothetical protein